MSRVWLQLLTFLPHCLHSSIRERLNHRCVFRHGAGQMILKVSGLFPHYFVVPCVPSSATRGESKWGIHHHSRGQMVSPDHHRQSWAPVRTRRPFAIDIKIGQEQLSAWRAGGEGLRGLQTQRNRRSLIIGNPQTLVGFLFPRCFMAF